MSAGALISFVSSGMCAAASVAIGLPVRKIKEAWNQTKINYVMMVTMIIVMKESLKKGNKKGKSNKTHKHHIVAKKAKAADSARKVLSRNKIGINSKRNLVKLKKHFHQYLHKKQYYAGVNAVMNASQSLVSVLRRLYPNKIKKSKVRQLKTVTAKGALMGMKVVLKGANVCAK